MATSIQIIIRAYVEASGYKGGDYRRLLRPASLILKRSDGVTEDAIERIRDTKRWADNNNIRWSLYTVLKRWNKENITKEEVVKINKTESLGDLLRRKYDRSNLV
jgi:hypothetical protein